MTNKTTNTSSQALDILAFLLSLFYVHSILTVAHHTSMWVHDGSSRTVESPGVLFMVIGLALIGYTWYKNKKTPSTLAIVALTIFATASLFWLSGLRTNFYF